MNVRQYLLRVQWFRALKLTHRKSFAESLIGRKKTTQGLHSRSSILGGVSSICFENFKLLWDSYFPNELSRFSKSQSQAKSIGFHCFELLETDWRRYEKPESLEQWQDESVAISWSAKWITVMNSLPNEVLCKILGKRTVSFFWIQIGSSFLRFLHFY